MPLFKKFKIGRVILRPGNPLILGVLNVTPDSFSDGGRFTKPKLALDHALRMEGEGADIIDVGGESSRPGAKPVTPKQEMDRVVPVIKAIRKRSSIPISIDTRNGLTAIASLDAGADMVNDITGFTDKALVEVARKYKIPVVAMHMKGTPSAMQKKPAYSDVVGEISHFLSRQAKLLEKCGIDKIILDPGIGFGKTMRHNFEILKRLEEIIRLGHPVMIGASRKSFIGALTGADVNRRLSGTLTAHLWSVMKGAAIVRAHDVAEHRQALDILKNFN